MKNNAYLFLLNILHSKSEDVYQLIEPNFFFENTSNHCPTELKISQIEYAI